MRLGREPLGRWPLGVIACENRAYRSYSAHQFQFVMTDATKYVFLSRDALDVIAAAGTLSQSDCVLSDLVGFPAAMRAASGAVTVVADVEQIDDKLAREIRVGQQEQSLSIGVIPFSKDYPSRVVDLCRPKPAAAAESVRAAVYSVDPKHDQDLQSLSKAFSNVTCIQRPKKDEDESEAQQLHLTRFDLFAGVVNGRQTFCMFGKAHCFHPGPDTGSSFVLTPESLQIPHWFLQSCHSPFVWSDFGRYLSFPQAMLLRGNASSFLASIRVQPFIPHLLASYLRLALAGISLGGSVLR